MEHAAIKLSSEFNITWDVNHVLNSFINIPVEEQILDERGWTTDSDNRPHWQMLEQLVSISRFFYERFPVECQLIAEELKKLQISLAEQPHHPLVQKFLDHEITPDRVHLLKIRPGDFVRPHRDERNFTVNIGLKNSNTADTYVSDSMTTTTEEFWNRPRYGFTMQDKDVYLLSVQHLHAVESMVAQDSGVYRYLISYSI